MTDEEMVVVIARGAGWQIITDSMGTHHLPPDMTVKGFIGMGEPYIELPDYFDDLNEMHYAEMTLVFSLRERYKAKLQVVMTEDDLKGLPEGQYISYSELYRATSRHRARAFYELMKEEEKNESN